MAFIYPYLNFIKTNATLKNLNKICILQKISLKEVFNMSKDEKTANKVYLIVYSLTLTVFISLMPDLIKSNIEVISGTIPSSLMIQFITAPICAVGTVLMPFGFIYIVYDSAVKLYLDKHNNQKSA